MRHPLTAEEVPSVETPALEFTYAEMQAARERQARADRERAETVLVNLDAWEAPLSEDALRLLEYIDRGRDLTSRAMPFGSGILAGQEADYRKYLIDFRKFLNRFGEFLGPAENPLAYLAEADMNAKRLAATLPGSVRLALLDAEGKILATRTLPETNGVPAEKVFEDLGKIIDTMDEMKPVFEAFGNALKLEESRKALTPSEGNP
jgi:hypothetical protein